MLAGDKNLNKTCSTQNITMERKKAIYQCFNLQTKNEQLNLLIRQLQNLACVKENNSINLLANDLNNEFDYVRPASLIINRELSIALKDQETISNDIKLLKEKILALNNKL